MSIESAERVILASGATGSQGGAVVRKLLDAGFKVKALSRTPDKPNAKNLSKLGVEVVWGDLGDPESLRPALEGVYGVFSVQQYFGPGYDEEVRQGSNLTDAAKESGVEHIVYSSVCGADRGTGIPHFESKWEIETHLRDSGLPYTILRPVSFMQNWEWMRSQVLGGVIVQPLDPDKTMQQIAVEDIGGFATMAFEQPERWIGREIEIAGDETTMLEAAEVFSRVTGREVTYSQTTWDQFAETVPEEITHMFRWLNDAGGEADIPTLRGEYPPLTAFEQYLRDHGWDSADTM